MPIIFVITDIILYFDRYSLVEMIFRYFFFFISFVSSFRVAVR